MDGKVVMDAPDIGASFYLLKSPEDRIKENISQDEVVKIIDDVLYEAILVGASDIHLQPTENDLRIRFRIDGVLYDQKPIDLRISPNIISRLKVLASIDIAQKRIPQDGKIKIVVQGIKKNKNIDLRVSTFPSMYGEKIVVRILDRSILSIKLDLLGFDKEVLNKISDIISMPNGFFIVTGPTGSGKTTTLYAILSELNDEHKNIITMEDPIEYDIDGITQSQVNEKAGFTFENGLRSILRQDPDIVMVGEIRDKPTCKISIESALTGHLVLSTLHTNDASGAITRLLDMGVEFFLINASLTAVLAQRLARKLCDHCKQEIELTKVEKDLLAEKNIKLKKIYKSSGCKKCLNLGYKGRVGIFELLVIDDEIRKLINKKSPTDLIVKQAMQNGMITLFQDGLRKVQDGIISLDEFLRVISS